MFTAEYIVWLSEPPAMINEVNLIVSPLCKVMKNRNNVLNLIDIPNVGKATIRYLNIVGVNAPFDLIGQNPYSMFEELCKITGKQFDPCLADVFVSAVKYMEGAPERKWWYYTDERKKKLGPEKK